MRFIHATVLDSGTLALWVERCSPAGVAPSRDEAGAHPWGSDLDVAREAVCAWLGLPEEVALPTELVALRLPTQRGLPLPSSDLGPRRDDETDDDDPFRGVPEPPALTSWTVAACVLRPPEAVLLLTSLADPPPPAVRQATDLQVWTAVARFTLSLLHRGRLVPTLVYEEAGGRRGAPAAAQCGWAPLLDGEGDAVTLATLADALPPSGRCHGSEPPPARDAVMGFIHTAVDELARHWIARAGLPPMVLSEVLPGGPVRAWLGAVREGRRLLEGRGGGLSALSEETVRWMRARQPVEGRLDFRTGFRLVAPIADDAEAWFVQIFFEAVDEPALQVEAGEVWDGDVHLLERGGRRLESPQQKLLGDLGRALRVFAALGRALAEPRPSRCALNLDEAATFIRTTAWLLQESGFAVSLPPWATDPSAGPRLRLKVREGSSPRTTIDIDEASDDGEGARFGLQALLAYEWQVALGGDAMDPREFERLTATKVHLVRMRDGWALIEPAPAAVALALWAAREGAPLTLGDALRLAAGADAAQSDLAPVELMLEGDLAALTDIRQVRAVAPPPDLRAQLRPYQAQGVSWLVDRLERGLGACLADDMGLGKSVQLVSVLLHERGRGPWLLVCPTSLVGNWVREIEKFAPSLRVAVHHGRERASGWEGADVVLTTYGLAGRDESLLERAWRGVALDEAQNIKNADSRQARGVRALRCTARIAMTGTPVENRLADLWSIMEFLEPGLFGTREAFRRRFAVPIERDGNDARRAQLRRAVAPFLLRRVKTDPTVIPDLPEKIERKIFCPLSREQASLYEATVRERLGRIDSSDGIARRGVVLSTMLRLKQICNHPAHFLGDDSALATRSGKLARLEEMLDEVLAGGERALVFTQFREWAVRLSEHLRERLGVAVACLHGETPRDERDRLVQQFQADDGPPVFILSVKAGGVGLTLTRATHIFHFDRWWNPAVENQATDRAFRIGQRRDVQVHKLVCQGTLEESIDRLLESKRGLAESVVGGGEAWLTEMTTGELAEIIALRDTALEDDD